MAITPNYSWPLPDDTSLVKDGAEAIRDLGNAIDTTVDGLGSGGLVHIKTVTFSGAVSHSFGSDADPIFTSDFTNYKILIDDARTTANNVINFRLRANTTDLTSNNYDFQSTNFSGSGFGASRSAGQNAARIAEFGFFGDERSSVMLEIQNPQTAKFKTFFSNNMHLAGGIGPIIRQFAGQVKNSVSHNGFTIFSATNISGTVSVYGYKI